MAMHRKVPVNRNVLHRNVVDATYRQVVLTLACFPYPSVVLFAVHTKCLVVRLFVLLVSVKRFNFCVISVPDFRSFLIGVHGDGKTRAARAHEIRLEKVGTSHSFPT